MKNHFTPKAGPSRLEVTLSWTIVGVLVVVAVGVYLKQFRYDPNTWIPRKAIETVDGDRAGNGSVRADLEGLSPPSLRPMGPLEAFGPDTLSDKIDGKAELYLPAGFVHLHCRRYALAADSTGWLEVFIYDMGELRNAFAVFSAQRRSEATPFSLTSHAYRTRNALFFVHGKYYVEVVASSASPAMMDAATNLARQFVEKTPQEGDRIEILELFPRKGLDVENRSLIVSNAFGFQGLNDVFTAPYRVEGVELTAFITKQADGDETRRLVGAYRDFLLQNGGKSGEMPSLPGGEMIRLFGTVEIFFPCGPYMAGIHQAEAEEPAKRLAGELLTHLRPSCE